MRCGDLVSFPEQSPPSPPRNPLCRTAKMSGLSTTGAGGASASSSSSVSSRFVSASDLEAAAQKRQEEWKAAYARIGQEPPAQDPEGEKYDPRSLWEKLNENKVLPRVSLFRTLHSRDDENVSCTTHLDQETRGV